MLFDRTTLVAVREQIIVDLVQKMSRVLQKSGAPRERAILVVRRAIAPPQGVEFAEHAPFLARVDQWVNDIYASG